MEVSAPPSATNNLLHHNLHDPPTQTLNNHHMNSKSPGAITPLSPHRHQLLQQQQDDDDVDNISINRISSPSLSPSQQLNSRSNSSSSEIDKELDQLRLAGVNLNATVVLENGTSYHNNHEKNNKNINSKTYKSTNGDGGGGGFGVDVGGIIDSNNLNGTSGLSTSVTSTTTIGTTGSSSSSQSITGTTAAATTTGLAVTTIATTTAPATSLKKRISSSRTPTRKARRIRFLRNGDRFYAGITIPVSNERYRSFDSLAEDLTKLLQENVKIPGAVRNIYTLSGKKISNLDELEDGQNYVCSCNNESFKKVEYNSIGGISTVDGSGNIGGNNSSGGSDGSGGALAKNKQNNRLTKVYRPSSPLKNGGINGSPILKVSERDSVVHPRIVTLIRNGTKPRKIMRLLLNKRNSPSFDHILTAITQVVKLDSGCVRKVFTISGQPVLQLADFFGAEDEFFAYGTERVNPDDFKLETDEIKIIRSTKKPLRNGSSVSGPKPKMPIKSKNLHNITYDCLDETLIDAGIQLQDLPLEIRERYALGNKVGDGNFAVVLKVADKQTNETYALKIIDKSKCKGKEHYIDAEVRVMKKLHHPHIIDLILDVDRPDRMYLVLEYVGGGDLFDAITQVTRFSEDQSRVMIRHLASAMAYLHSMSIVHRDIKPENLLVEIDSRGNVVELKLADFGLACEVTEPLLAVCGTPTYVAPEILMETGYALKIDVWAAGIILYILLCGFPPFVSPDNQQEPLFDAILSGVYEFPDPYWSDIGEGVRDLISNMLQSDPDVRFSSEDILDHYWTMGENSDEYR